MKTITVQQLKKMISEGKSLKIVDVRSPLEFRMGHIPGAVNMPLGSFGPEIPGLEKGEQLVMVCQAGSRSHAACQQVLSTVPGVMNLEGGTGSWISAGLEVEKAAIKPWPLDRQTHLVAGLLVAAAFILSFTVNPNWVYLAALPGFGLLLHALTGICPMTLLLAKLPMNRGAAEGCSA